MKLEFSQKYFRKILKYKFSQNSIQWEPSCSTDGRTDRHYEDNGRFLQFCEHVLKAHLTLRHDIQEFITMVTINK
jgi:hypothetical protein